MTIDEAIALVKIERECVIRADACDRKCEKCDLLQDSTELTDMYEQLVEWLEDYKRIKMLIPIEQALKAEYNKGIDDFVRFANTMPTVEAEDGTIRPMWLEEIAEQLKAGDAK